MNGVELKIAAAREAMSEVRSGMRLGLGTGSTARELVILLGEALASGALTGIRCTTTSSATEAQARSLDIPTFSLHEIAPLDLAIDGADEIDSRLRLIKGRGGALLREKIVEQAARRFLVIADESKVVPKLGAGVLPVEVTPFALGVVTDRLATWGFNPLLRMRDDAPYVTDEGHRLLDIQVPADEDIADVVSRIREQAGVVETGFFPTEASEAIIAGAGGVRRMSR
jgi:ribose 5-phosphate isomerase A